MVHEAFHDQLIKSLLATVSADFKREQAMTAMVAFQDTSILLKHPGTFDKHFRISMPEQLEEHALASCSSALPNQC